MGRTIRAVVGAVLILVIAFSAISVCQSVEGRYYRPEDLYAFEGHKINFGQAQPAD
jgi:hypothetical protein